MFLLFKTIIWLNSFGVNLGLVCLQKSNIIIIINIIILERRREIVEMKISQTITATFSSSFFFFFYYYWIMSWPIIIKIQTLHKVTYNKKPKNHKTNSFFHCDCEEVHVKLFLFVVINYYYAKNTYTKKRVYYKLSQHIQNYSKIIIITTQLINTTNITLATIYLTTALGSSLPVIPVVVPEGKSRSVYANLHRTSVHAW